MNFKFTFLLVALTITVQSFAQKNLKLKAQIDKLANSVIKDVNTEDVFISSGKANIGTADYQNVKKIVMSNGFPTISMVGKETSHKFWMMVQLCDTDIQMQVAVLKQMGRYIRTGEASKEDYAMLTDRTRMNRKLPQLYGTQYVINEYGDVEYYRIHDMDNVDIRRKTLNLSKFNTAKSKVMEVSAERKLSRKSTGLDDRPRQQN